MLKQHRTREDAWSAFNGKVYNITPYIDYHPGGAKELMRVAGRDGSKLFGTHPSALFWGNELVIHVPLALTHSWVNLDYMLDACHIGYMVSEPTS